MKKISQGAIPEEVFDYILLELKKIRSGEIIFVAQDGYLMQVDVERRRRLSDWSTDNPMITDEICANLKNQIAKEFAKLAYGRLVVKIQKGHVVQIERTVQQRFTGLDGEGI